MGFSKVDYDLAVSFATRAHNNQYDKSGKPYIYHPIAVASYFKDNKMWLEAIVSILHDIAEDTDITIEEIGIAFGDIVSSKVEVLTRRPYESYRDYILRIKDDGDNVDIKIQDLLHNMDLSRLKEIKKNDLKRTKKYIKALEMLIEE